MAQLGFGCSKSFKNIFKLPLHRRCQPIKQHPNRSDWTLSILTPYTDYHIDDTPRFPHYTLLTQPTSCSLSFSSSPFTSNSTVPFSPCSIPTRRALSTIVSDDPPSSTDGTSESTSAFLNRSPVLSSESLKEKKKTYKTRKKTLDELKSTLAKLSETPVEPSTSSKKKVMPPTAKEAVFYEKQAEEIYFYVFPRMRQDEMKKFMTNLRLYARKTGNDNKARFVRILEKRRLCEPWLVPWLVQVRRRLGGGLERSGSNIFPTL